VSPQTEKLLVEKLRRGDAASFHHLVDRYNGPLLRLARVFVPSREVAEEVVQETWIGVLEGVHRFEGRSSLKTWIFRILKNLARTRGVRERRTVPFSSVGPENEPAWALPDRSGGWRWLPSLQPAGAVDPERQALGQEILNTVLEALRPLPDLQKAVVALRDLYAWSAREVCEELGLSDTYQRVLLHRGRLKIRDTLERKLLGPGTPARSA